jgi:hypothetical protein
MVQRSDNVEFKFSIASSLEDTGIDLDLLNARAVELFQSCNNSCLFASTGWAVDKKVGKISALRLEYVRMN